MDDQSLQLIEYLNRAVSLGSIAYDSQLIINSMLCLKIVSIDTPDFEGFSALITEMNNMNSFVSLIKKKIALHEPFASLPVT
jgi:hypothetical protein